MKPITAMAEVPYRLRPEVVDALKNLAIDSGVLDGRESRAFFRYLDKLAARQFDVILGLSNIDPEWLQRLFDQRD